MKSLADIRFEQTLAEVKASRPNAFRESDKVLAIREQNKAEQAARRFLVYCRKNGEWGGQWSEMMPQRELVAYLTRQPLEKCRKRDATHYYQIVEVFEGQERDNQVRAEYWVGSFAEILLTDWQKEYNAFAHRGAIAHY